MVTGDPRTGGHGGAPRRRPPRRGSDAPRAAAAAATGAPRPGGRGGGLFRRLQTLATWAAVALVLLVVASLAGVLPLQLMRVDSASMTPTIGSGDLVLVRHGSGPVDRGDVVAVADPREDGLLVKRVVGVAGDRVSIEDGVLVVNGTPVCERTIDPALIDGVWFGPATVPPASLFLLSDNRDGSIDSRAFGAVPASSVLGHVTGRVWPHPGGLPPTGC